MGKTRCEVCRKKCVGDILRADDKHFHLACFKCHQCSRPLSETGYFSRDNKYYCPADYHVKFGERCAHCRDYVEGDIVQCMGGTFHQRCFACTRCRRPFAKDEKVTVNDGNGTDRLYLCTKCVALAQPIRLDTTMMSDGTTTTGAPVSPPMASPTVCAACDQLMQSGQVLLALGTQWHIWCFKCATCCSVLHGEYMAKDGKPYCVRDYNAQFGVRCYECDKFIAGKVLQAGGYKFHPTCARCSRCNEHFGDGEEMYMQADDIWHPRCHDIKPPDNILHASPKVHRGSGRVSGGGAEPKYQTHFGQHLTYMYLLPEVESTYLKHPIEPHPQPPAQFHTPLAPIKIRKSRISMFKTGMQRLAEDLEKSSPRPKSPYMDNEEPIEMAHYPGGRVPDPNVVPAIERDDFPAPPYPYAVEELKRRLSTSSVENDADDDAEQDAADVVDGERLKRKVDELDKFEKDSSIAHVIKQNLEEQQKKTRQPLHVDPRNASRTPSAKKNPHLKCRYETPINASPSRYLNRPRPWMYWEGGDKAATTSIPYFLLPRGYVGSVPKAATLPDGYRQYYGDMSEDNLDVSVMSNYSAATGQYSPPQRSTGTMPAGSAYAPASYRGSAVRSSLPDMSKPPKIYQLHELQTTNKKLPDDVDRCHLERHLIRSTFEELFHMSPIEFYRQPEWKRVNMKRKVKLF